MLRNLIHSVTHIRERVKEKRENEVQTGVLFAFNVRGEILSPSTVLR